MVVAARLTLSNIRRFDALFRLLQAEGDRLPELRHTVTAALFGSGALGSWVDDPARLIAIAAMTGYHLFEQLNDQSFQVVSEDEFIAALAAVLPPGRPPGMDESTHAAMKAAPKHSPRRA